MNTSSGAELDADELLHLAVAASDRDRSDEAISLLKRAILVDPQKAEAHYLLGAEHAQIGLFDRAIDDMRRALQINERLDAARFQLGLLLLSSRQPQAAEDVWQGLEPLGPQHFYVLFKTGLLHLARDEFAACKRCLHAGIEANTTLAPLNHDMQRILEQVEQLLANQGGPSDGDGSAGGHLFLDAYTRHH